MGENYDKKEEDKKDEIANEGLETAETHPNEDKKEGENQKEE